MVWMKWQRRGVQLSFNVRAVKASKDEKRWRQTWDWSRADIAVDVDAVPDYLYVVRGDLS